MGVASAPLVDVAQDRIDDLDFDYFVNGIRLGYKDVELLADNRLYVPDERGTPYGEYLRPEVRQLLVDNGTLNADFAPNEATAALHGWKLKEAGSRAAELAEMRAKGRHASDAGGELVRRTEPAARPGTSER